MIQPTYMKGHLWSYFIIIPHGWISELRDVRMTPLQIWISSASERGNTTQRSFKARLRNSEKRLLASSFLSVRMEQLSPHWTYFHEIWYFSTFRNCVHKIQVPLQSNKNNGHFTVLIIPRSVLLKIRNVSDESWRENQNIHFVCSKFFFESCAV